MKCLLNLVDVQGLWIRPGRVSENHQGWFNGVSRLIENTDLAPDCTWSGWLGSEFNKGIMAPVRTVLPGESFPEPCPSSLHSEVSQFSSAPCIALVFSELLPLIRVNEFMSKQVCVCPLSRSV